MRVMKDNIRKKTLKITIEWQNNQINSIKKINLVFKWKFDTTNMHSLCLDHSYYITNWAIILELLK